ncbi:hypothetical protein [Sphingomonas alpina]|uniref:Uncharacterized protein n=2 Tax=Sphingomonas alpina TaxID=653931 RepID=A0A7H0LFV8_9SPHN|nr:hypothetical protein [Sphingomonas alpina]QNQ08561.1 hypothetical protein H3Z74_17680 [Sphingomonas alpina]
MHTLLAALVAAAPIQATAPDVPVAASVPAPTETEAQREERYLRQQVAVDNARLQVEALRAEIKLKDELLVLARDRNAELYKIASEILARHAKRRSWEPFIQSSRVRLENLVQSYEDRLRAARVTEATLPPSVAAQMERELAPTNPADAQAKPVPTDPK